MATTESQHLFNDLSRIKSIGVGKEKDTPESMRKAANQFESLFIDMMIKSMRKANEVLGSGGIFNSKEEKLYKEMLDSQLAQEMAGNGGIGIADELLKQFEKRLDSVRPTKGFKTQEDFEIAPKQRRFSLIDVSYNIENSTNKIISNHSQKNTGNHKQSFIESVKESAMKAAQSLGVSPGILAAQAALETGWGEHLPKAKDGISHNYFGIKSNKNSTDIMQQYTYEFLNGKMQKQLASFRTYHNMEESFIDYANFIQENPRYSHAINLADEKKYIQALHQAGYATDPKYAEKVMSIRNSKEMLAAFGHPKQI